MNSGDPSTPSPQRHHLAFGTEPEVAVPAVVFDVKEGEVLELLGILNGNQSPRIRRREETPTRALEERADAARSLTFRPVAAYTRDQPAKSLRT